MNPSQLESHRSFILQKVHEGLPINRICIELKKLNCSISRSYLKDWILRSGIQYTPLKRGRPPKCVRCRISLLPPTTSPQQTIATPLFLFGLNEEASAELMVGTRKSTLESLGLPSYSSPPAKWPDLQGYADLSDLELLFLAFLRSGLEAPPFAEGGQALDGWYQQLVTLAIDLREEITVAIESRKV